mmetsp:Transcript_108905/g.198355  ORF Transcript_108905/g.198355 Transcript_108905/m.198355 type:complete len:230 (-) Transcript_108905:3402-4091(-)
MLPTPGSTDAGSTPCAGLCSAEVSEARAPGCSDLIVSSVVAPKVRAEGPSDLKSELGATGSADSVSNLRAPGCSGAERPKLPGSPDFRVGSEPTVAKSAAICSKLRATGTDFDCLSAGSAPGKAFSPSCSAIVRCCSSKPLSALVMMLNIVESAIAPSTMSLDATVKAPALLDMSSVLAGKYLNSSWSNFAADPMIVRLARSSRFSSSIAGCGPRSSAIVLPARRLMEI